MTDPRAQGFPPILPARPWLLILGTMPGRASLEAGVYYAHPRNAFWPLMEELLAGDAPPRRSYEERVELLRAAGIALWDVLHSCRRPGSLDAAIEPRSAVPNGVAALIQAHPSLECVAFNGAQAEALFRRHIRPALDAAGRQPACHRLPSTSPANASWSYERKRAAWAGVIHGEGSLG